LKTVVSSYISQAFGDKKRRTVARAVKSLKAHEGEFDCIAVRGTSGLLVGTIVSYLLKKPLIVVRKPKSEVSSHASYMVEAETTEGRYLILDDLTGGGETVRSIQKEIKKLHPKLVSNGFMYLYHNEIGPGWQNIPLYMREK
jgi:adenine/guanine phosphoribosyltransferase-like PRPP-binding protein